MNSQRGFVSALECGVKDGEANGHFVMQVAGPNGGNRRYLWLSPDETRNLMMRLATALAEDAVNRGDNVAALEASAAAGSAHEVLKEAVNTLFDLQGEG